MLVSFRLLMNGYLDCWSLDSEAVNSLDSSLEQRIEKDGIDSMLKSERFRYLRHRVVGMMVFALTL
jgi:hypothetical protein